MEMDRLQKRMTPIGVGLLDRNVFRRFRDFHPVCPWSFIIDSERKSIFGLGIGVDILMCHFNSI